MTTTLEREFVAPERFVWTRAKYEHATELGLFGPDDHIELIEGEIVQKMPVNSPHSTAVMLTENALRRAFSSGHILRVQQPLSVGAYSQPEPDVAVVRGSARDYTNAQPGSDMAPLVVEVSDTTLGNDRTKKSLLYARAGIPEYWIVNINDRLLEVYRHPAPAEDGSVSHSYRQVLRLTETEAIAPLAAEETIIAVADLLP